MRTTDCLAPLFAATLLFATTTASAQSPALLLRGGTVYDGTGAPGRVADVGVRGDRVVFVGEAPQAGFRAERTIDATGLVVAPGFIDPHGHALGQLGSADAGQRRAENWLRQGVTTVITGNDGGGPVEVGATLARWERAGIGPNAALLVGFGRLRGAVVGAGDGVATPAQRDSMRALTARAMREGALGLSTGLFYHGQSGAPTAEVVALAREAAMAGGYYDTHLRDEGSYGIGLIGAVQEALRIGRDGGLPVHIAHLKALGVDVWGQADTVLALLRAARASGQMVTADQYPYTASGTSLTAALLPRWAEAGGRDSLRARLARADDRARIVRDMTDNLRRRGGDSSLLLIDGPAGAAAWRGRTLAQVAAARGASAVDAALWLIGEFGDLGVASFNMRDADIERFMQADFVFSGSDGSGGHPRLFGTYPRLLRRYVLDRPVLSMERMIARSSGDVARMAGVRDRGTLVAGAFADLVVFDPRTVRDRATYEAPTQQSEGMRWVFVNGVAVIDDGRLTDALPGRALRRDPLDAVRAATRAWRVARERAIVRELATLVAIPNVASDSVNIRRNAAHLMGMLQARGLAPRLLENGPHPPAVYGERRVPGATRTVMLYAHYDGQPVVAAEWASPPWEPVLLDAPRASGGRRLSLDGDGRLPPEGRLYGRSSSDDKAPIVALLAALDALQAQGREPAVNLKVFLDGEEEAGDEHLDDLLRRNRELLAADVWLFGDGPVHQSRAPQLVFGVRGTLGLEARVYGPARALHSGHYGNWAPNPGALIAQLVSDLRAVDSIAIPGFLDDVRPTTAAERAAMAATPAPDSALRDELALGGTEAGNAPLAERIMLPALNVRGVRYGQVGATASNTIGTDAWASFDFRLVPDQTPDKVRTRVEAHLRARGWTVVHDSATLAQRRGATRLVWLDWGDGYAGIRTPLDLPVSVALREVSARALGRPVIAVPMLGGSLPMATFAEVLQVPLIIVPIVNHDNSQHAKDENVRLQNLWDGIEWYAGVMVGLRW